MMAPAFRPRLFTREWPEAWQRCENHADRKLCRREPEGWTVGPQMRAPLVEEKYVKARDRLLATLTDGHVTPWVDSPSISVIRRRLNHGAVVGGRDGDSATAIANDLLQVPWFDFRKMPTADVEQMATFGVELIKAGILKPPFSEVAFVVSETSAAEGLYIQIAKLHQMENWVHVGTIANVYRNGRPFITGRGDGKTYPLSDNSEIFYFLAAMSSRQARVQSVDISSGKPRELRSANDLDVYREVTIRPFSNSHGDGTHTHASPRLHWRRGHIRHLGDEKKTWVRPCLVGDGEHGTIIHDYVA